MSIRQRLGASGSIGPAGHRNIPIDIDQLKHLPRALDPGSTRTLSRRNSQVAGVWALLSCVSAHLEAAHGPAAFSAGGRGALAPTPQNRKMVGMLRGHCFKLEASYRLAVDLTLGRTWGKIVKLFFVRHVLKCGTSLLIVSQFAVVFMVSGCCKHGVCLLIFVELYNFR